MHTRRTLFEELARQPTLDVETRGENAFNAGVKFLDLLRDEIKDEKAFDLVMKAWFRAVKDGDYTKFARNYRKHTRGV